MNIDVVKNRLKQGKKSFDYLFLIAGDINPNMPRETKEINELAQTCVKYSLESGAK